jgi:hypothetical protein
MKRDGDYQVRKDALSLAAEAFKSGAVNHENASSDLWCLAVFFESYLREGSRGTRREFGPKGPTSLKLASKRSSIGCRN